MREYVVILESRANQLVGIRARSARLRGRGPSREETMDLIRQAIDLHVEGMREDGDPVPEPSTETFRVQIPA
jgi:hypothetical protein